MRSTAAVLDQVSGLLTVESIEVEEPRAGEVLVRVAHCGVCHSDLSVVDGGFPSPFPVVLGHEASGVVEAIGVGVVDVRPGDHVVLTPAPNCGHCYFCTRRQPTLCERYRDSLLTATRADGSTPLSRDGAPVFRGLATGAFSEYTVVSADAVIPIPADADLAVACVIGCAVQTGVGAVLNTARVEVGATVLVLGAGGIGISVVQGAVVAGASRIVVVEPDADRRTAATRFGATDVLDPTSDDVLVAAFDLTRVGFDYAFETAGRAALIEQGINGIRPGGTVVAVGAPPMAEALQIPMVVGFTAMEKKLLGCLLGSANSQLEIPRLIGLWQAGRLDLDAMVTGRRPLTEINEAMADARARKGLRTVVDVG